MMKKMLVSAAILVSLFATPLVATGVTQAAVAPECDGSSFLLGFPTWYKYLDVEFVNGSCNIVGPKDSTGAFNWKNNIGLIILAVVEIMLRIAALVAVGFIIYGGFRYILSQGNSDTAGAARKTIINAVIGLIIAMFATAIVSFVARSLS